MFRHRKSLLNGLERTPKVERYNKLIDPGAGNKIEWLTLSIGRCSLANTGAFEPHIYAMHLLVARMRQPGEPHHRVDSYTYFSNGVLARVSHDNVLVDFSNTAEVMTAREFALTHGLTMYSAQDKVNLINALYAGTQDAASA